MPRKTAPSAPYTLMTLACDALQVDADIQPRLALNPSVVEEYATLYEEAEEDEDPMDTALHVFQIDGGYFVADGFHRLAAAKQASRKTLRCQVYTGTRRDAMVHAVFANLKRGLKYSQDDNQRILERLLADPNLAQRGDRALARDLGWSHMTVWRARARQTEEARLQAKIAAMPATAKAPKAREQEQIAAYLGVPVDDIKDSIGTSSMRYGSPQEIIKDIAHRTVVYNEPPQEAAKQVAKRVTHVAVVTTSPPQTPPRPSQSKAVVAARQAEARRQYCYETLNRALYSLIALYPFTLEEQESNPYAYSDPSSWRRPSPTLPTADELVAAVLPQDVERIAQYLPWARTVLDSLCSAWEVRTQETAASV